MHLLQRKTIFVITTYTKGILLSCIYIFPGKLQDIQLMHLLMQLVFQFALVIPFMKFSIHTVPNRYYQYSEPPLRETHRRVAVLRDFWLKMEKNKPEELKEIYSKGGISVRFVFTTYVDTYKISQDKHIILMHLIFIC